MAKPLTNKQEMFCLEYLIDLNATQAAIRAGYSVKTAQEQACRLLTNVKVQELVTKLKRERSEAVKINAEWVLSELKAIHELDVLDIHADDGTLLGISEWPKAWRVYINGLDLSESGGDEGAILKKIKWPDKVKNLEMIGKHVSVQAWNEKTTTEATLKVSDSLAARLTGGNKR